MLAHVLRRLFIKCHIHNAGKSPKCRLPLTQKALPLLFPLGLVLGLQLDEGKGASDQGKGASDHWTWDSAGSEACQEPEPALLEGGRAQPVALIQFVLVVLFLIVFLVILIPICEILCVRERRERSVKIAKMFIFLKR